ncbi:MAG: ATP-dependent DNA helicase RecG [Chitinophagaceae bacterium]
MHRTFNLSIISFSQSISDTPIEYLKGVGPVRAALLQKELGIYTFRDMLNHFPLRHIDKTSVQSIHAITPETDYIQVAGFISQFEIIGEKTGRRLVAYITDGSGYLELVWFRGIQWVQKNLFIGKKYLVYGKISYFNSQPQISHPDLEMMDDQIVKDKFIYEPVYPSTEKLKTRNLNGRQLAKLTATIFTQINEKEIPENLPPKVLEELKLTGRYKAYQDIHFPKTMDDFNAAVRRLKFEELFLAQVRFKMIRNRRHHKSQGVLFEKVGDLFNTFYTTLLPFELTNAQKKVFKEIRQDTVSGRQMNRLLQGDVGSGKTIVALLALLLAVDNGFQGCMMAPTEILSRQHFYSIQKLIKDLPVNVHLLTGSTKASERKKIFKELKEGDCHILIGTHAIIEDKVEFKNLGIAIVDEQHRFGVAQRAKLWKKSAVPPHILVMTATPIPRTLAMSVYGDLDYSIMDELPPGRLEIKTIQRNEMKRMEIMEFIKGEIQNGRQAYIIYPLIEESEKLSYEDLMQGYEQVKVYFPEHLYNISMVHGRMPALQKEVNMQRFKNGESQILVATTVIEVGVDVPNASVMVIESAEKFGLSQLHQLRGRVGRGAEKSYCILLTGSKVSNEARQRLKILCDTNNGFKIAEKDLALRGPGNIEGTKQSGALDFKLADIILDQSILEAAKRYADTVLDNDPGLVKMENSGLKNYILSQKGKTAWSKIS